MSKNVFFKRSLIVLLSFSFFISTVISFPATVNAEPEYNFAKALQLSLYFYDANKCGPGITGGRLEWRGDCHVEDKELPLIPLTEGFRGTNLSQSFIDKYRSVLDPDGNGSLDLSGGMHDAGDHVKFGLPQSYAASTVGWGYYEFRDAYIKIGEKEHVEDILRWFNDYFLRSTFRDKDGNVIAFCYVVGEGDIDHDWWNPPELQNSKMIKDFERPAYFATAEKPASDQCAGAAASLAINYLNFKDEDPEYAKKCLDTAIALYDFARKYRGLGYSDEYYMSSYDYDEMSWAAVWLNIATGEKEYIDHIVATDASGKYTGYMQRIIVDTGNDWQNIWVHCWDTVWGGVFAKLAPITNTERDWYIFRWNLEYWSGVAHEDPKDTNFLSKTPAGFSMLNPYGSARYNTAAQLCAMVYRKCKGNTAFTDWAKNQMEYIMGNNPMKRAYIVGYAPDGASHPHHRASHGSKTLNMDNPKDQVHTLWGALVGGPDAEDFHKDITSDFIYNEVAVDYNAAFVGACAGLYTYYGEGHEPVPNFPPKETKPLEFFVEAKVSTSQENNERSQITLRIHNESAYPPHYETRMKVRYYFNISEILDAGQTINDVHMEVYYDENEKCYDGKAKYSEIMKYDDKGTYYVEFDWEGKQIYAAREIQFALIADQDKTTYKGNWNAKNDYSREGLGDEYVITKKCPLYIGNEIVFGEGPEGPIPTVTTIPATPTPDSNNFIEGYIKPDFTYTDTSINSGFKVEIEGSGKSVLTDSKGYFKLTDVKFSSSSQTIKISKENYLYREIKNIVINKNVQLSTAQSPIMMWAGDIVKNGVQDNSINMKDVLEIAKSFNSISGNALYNINADLNLDGAINMSDVIIVSKHFSKTSADYM
ncbi:glycoside hydrolase family 9 protein [Pseudobacteroides cellulosolvens]|uniref:Cellulase n=1 Tax=Pseudobacteroides cellulosolvens ATCC 35603 = DSM 2933 TaxID=398512 RepID=A0A0L6JH33_9FIRM|nr:glycoside hydrolase family 9 protein [Pseudobacteroides cellulosolvens]KNY25033.1 Cellulase [Pseudobacteroides cellulosolvens ATCC 35603 = DSM 2933]